jgi:hypothetical protein
VITRIFHRNVFYEIKREEEPLKPEAIALVSKRRNEPQPQALLPAYELGHSRRVYVDLLTQDTGLLYA